MIIILIAGKITILSPNPIESCVLVTIANQVIKRWGIK